MKRQVNYQANKNHGFITKSHEWSLVEHHIKIHNIKVKIHVLINEIDTKS